MINIFRKRKPIQKSASRIKAEQIWKQIGDKVESQLSSERFCIRCGMEMNIFAFIYGYDIKDGSPTFIAWKECPMTFATLTHFRTTSRYFDKDGSEIKREIKVDDENFVIDRDARLY